MRQVAYAVSCYLEQNRLFDLDAARDGSLERYVCVKELLSANDIALDTLDLVQHKDIDVLIFSDISSQLSLILNTVRLNSTVKLIYTPTEPPVITFFHGESILSRIPFDRVLFWCDDFVTMCGCAVKCNIGQPLIKKRDIPKVAFKGKKFIAAIYSSKLVKHEHGLYEERLRAYDFFSKKEDGFDLYGMGWEKSSRPSVVTSYRGKVETKKIVLQNYKFSICFENAKGYPGLITEKIFDCFAAGTVPIYYGAPNIQEYIPKACFIDFRDFTGYDELYSFLVEMQEDMYQSYLKAVKSFIKTPAYYQFTSKRYAELVLEQVQMIMCEPGPKRTVLGVKLSLLKIVLTSPLSFVKNFKACRRFLFDIVTAW